MNARYLTRSEAALYVCDKGLKVSKNTLQKFATVGGGPIYRRFGNRAFYTPVDLDLWIDEKISSPIRSSSDVCCQPSSEQGGGPHD